VARQAATLIAILVRVLMVCIKNSKPRAGRGG
jgi:hypothetical protein